MARAAGASQTPGVRIGPYATQGELGRGGMGVVYRARSPQGGDVAVKVLLRRDPETLARFERERRLIATFTAEDGFVPLIDAGASPLGPYLVMPLVPGGTLRERLARGPMGVEAALALARSLCGALARAHERGIVHRDLKPENVLFTADGKPLVADLGLAKHFGPDRPEASVSLSRSGAMRGTAGYMPVEQMRDAKAVGPPADTFALGAILYECLAGRPAFPGENGLEVLTRVDAGRREPLDRADVPSWLVAVLERALERDASRRYPDAVSLQRALAPPRKAGARKLVLAGAIGLVAAAFVAGVAWPRPRVPGRTFPLTPPAPPGSGTSTGTSSTATPASAATPSVARVSVAEPHTRPIAALAVARASGDVATASEDGTAKVWLVQSGALRTTLRGHRGPVRCVALSPDRGANLVATADRSTVRIWDRARGDQIVKSLPTEGALLLEFVSGDAGATELMVATEDGRALRWLFATDTVEPLPMKLGGPAALDYKWLAGSIVMFVGGRDGAVSLHDMVDARWRVPGKPGVACVALSPDQRRGLSGDREGRVLVWDVSLDSGSATRTLKHAKAVTTVAISPDARWGLSGAADGSARLFGLAARGAEIDFGSGPAIRAAGFAGLASVILARETRLELWDVRDPTEPRLSWAQ